MPALPATPPSRRGLDSTYTVSPRRTMRFGSISRGSEGLRFMRALTFGSARMLNAFFTPNHSDPFWRGSTWGRAFNVAAQRSISRSGVYLRIRSAASCAASGDRLQR